MSKTKVIAANVNIIAEKDSQGKAADSGEEQDLSTARFRAYRVVSIKEKVWAAARADDSWYEYVVDNGKSFITGRCPVKRKHVEEHVKQFVAKLNARGRNQKSAWSLHHGRPAKK